MWYGQGLHEAATVVIGEEICRRRTRMLVEGPHLMCKTLQQGKQKVEHSARMTCCLPVAEEVQGFIAGDTATEVFPSIGLCNCRGYLEGLCMKKPQTTASTRAHYRQWQKPHCQCAKPTKQHTVGEGRIEIHYAL